MEPLSYIIKLATIYSLTEYKISIGGLTSTKIF